MSFAEILEALPQLSFMERQKLMAALVHLDPPPVSEDERIILEARGQYALENPDSIIPLEKVKEILQEHYRNRLGSGLS